MLPLSNLCLKRLGEVLIEAEDTATESIFVKNMRTLIEYSYNPCCDYAGDNDVWKELQKTVWEFSIKQNSWFLGEPGSDLICEDKRLTKDILAGLINLLNDTDNLRIQAEGERLDLKAELARKSGLKKKRQALIIQSSLREYAEANTYCVVLQLFLVFHE